MTLKISSNYLIDCLFKVCLIVLFIIYEGRYYLLIENVKDTTYDTVISLAAEYGHASTLTLMPHQ